MINILNETQITSNSYACRQTMNHVEKEVEIMKRCGNETSNGPLKRLLS